MVDWKGAGEAVKSIFFEDTFALLPQVIEIDDIGEEVANPGEVIGQYVCNAQYQPISKQQKEQGLVTPQVLRISCQKSIPLVRGNVYYIKLIEARIQHNTDEVWEVTDWTEAQLSIVIMCKRSEVV